VHINEEEEKEITFKLLENIYFQCCAFGLALAAKKK
jgi:hypothetical protein